MIRIAIAGFQHETNTFAPTKASYEHFVHGGGFPPMHKGKEVLNLKEMNIPAGGFIKEIKKTKCELIPIIWTAASPSAHVEQDAFEKIATTICTAIKEQKPDAVYLDLHGAMVCEHYDDGEGELLKRVRDIVGVNIPIVATLDLHANVTQQMLEQADALIAYRTYPHVDMANTGASAAQTLLKLISNKKQFKKFIRLPFLISINAQCTFLEPAKSIYEKIVEIESLAPVQLSFCPGFPAADFKECGGVVWGYSQNQQALNNAVNQIYSLIIDREKDWSIDFLEPDEAVRQAMLLHEEYGEPIIIADTQDNPGAGGDANTTGMLKALIDMKAKNAAIGVIADARSAKAAIQAGVGNSIELNLGGDSKNPNNPPINATFKIQSISNGQCIYEGPMMTGVKVDVGPTVCLTIDDIEVVVSSEKAQTLDRNLFKMAGIDPAKKNIVVVKSSVHFRADFQSISSQILTAKSPGPLTADPGDLNWKNLSPDIKVKPLGKKFSDIDS